MKLNTDMQVVKINDYLWEIPPSEKPGMLVPARIYASAAILGAMDRGVFDQVTNVACLPGIHRYALCMPDGHWGTAFPSAVWPHSILRMESSHPAASATISTAGCG